MIIIYLKLLKIIDYPTKNEKIYKLLPVSSTNNLSRHEDTVILVVDLLTNRHEI